MHKPGIAVIVSGLLFVLTIFCAGAFANETTARLGVGGLSFTKSEDIRMLQEILQISRSQVKVKYRFMNESDRDIHTTVAFTLPPYHPSRSRSNEPDPADPWLVAGTFKVLVQGHPVSTEFSERKAVVGDRDLTSQLREFGLSDDQIFRTGDLTVDQWAALAGPDGENRGILDWRVAETVFWQQSFPAGKEIVIEHQYKPLIRFRFYSAYYNGLDADPLMPPCLDEMTGRSFVNRIIKAYAKVVEQDPWVLMYVIEYVLGTGRNWKGPIGEFKLRIEKLADEIMAPCFPGKFDEMSPTVYEFCKRDFVPSDKLVLYFYRVVHM